jgi:choice-of-anchor B domain-containing protein
MDLNALGGASNGNDCWGYVSPSGREYTLMGVSNKLVVVEITTPGSPVIVGSIAHTDSLWGDIKTYQTYAYVVNESGGGMDVVDLSDVDNGNVTEIQPGVTDFSTSHNVAVDEVSGYAYLAGANIHGGRLVAYSLADPAHPVQVGAVNSANGVYVHDAEIVTYTGGPYDGKQIAFCANGGTGLDIYDVTNKGNMFRLSRTTYANLSYAHQVWLSDDMQYAYLNDELDGVNETVIFDVTDLSAPQIVGTYDTGVGATDHNGYVSGNFVFEADYRAGMRVLCANDPLNPVLVGYFDTYPADDASGFEGAWSLYPYFPSGTAIVSDINRGLFILDPSDALSAGSLTFDTPNGLPAFIAPTGATVQFEIAAACGATIAQGTELLHYDTGTGFVSTPLVEIESGLYEAVFPALDCGSTVSYYVSAESTGGGLFTDPSGAPATSYSAIAAGGVEVQLSDNFEADQGWVEENLGAISGDWQRGVPVNDPDWAYDPESDSDGSGKAYLTQNEIGNTDVDEGAVRLTSPTLDLTNGPVSIGYDYYLNLTIADGVDRLLVEMSDSGDAGPWIEVALHTTSGGLSWRHHEMTQDELEAAGLVMTADMKIRFTGWSARWATSTVTAWSPPPTCSSSCRPGVRAATAATAPRTSTAIAWSRRATF